MQSGTEPPRSQLRSAPSGDRARVPPAVVDAHRWGGPLLPAVWRRRVPLIVALSAVGVAVLGLAVHGTHGPLAVERPLNDLLTSGRPHLNGTALFFADLSSPARLGGVLIGTLVVCIAGRSWRAVGTLVVALPATLAACEGLKVLVDRRQVLGALSFPSGHVAVASVLVTVVVLLARRHGPLGRRLPTRLSDGAVVGALVAVVVVAVSMVVLGDHYVTDTLAGAALGGALSLVAAALIDALAARAGHGR